MEPQPTDPHWPRYSARPFPAYRYVPGQTPHPRRHHHGHSYGTPEARPVRFPTDRWRLSEDYLYGIDLYNFAYWWECHEVFEGLWHAAGHDTEEGNFYQALIQLAAANLKHFLDRTTAAHNLLQRGLARFQHVPPAYMGIDVAGLSETIRHRMAHSRTQSPLIRLDMSQPPGSTVCA